MLILDGREHIFLFLYPDLIPFLDEFLDLLEGAAILVVDWWFALATRLEKVWYEWIFALCGGVHSFFEGEVLQHIGGFYLFGKTTRICFAS